MGIKVRRRVRLRRRDWIHWATQLASDYAMETRSEETPIDRAEAGDLRLLFEGHTPFAILVEDKIAPTARELLAHPARRRHVTVDMGAVPFIYNGADVMAPGIVDADPAIRAGDLVWVRDERNRQPIAVGQAEMDGLTMVRERKGKAIKTIHHVGDDIWRLGEEEP